MSSPTTPYCIVLVTCPSEAEAEPLVRQLLTQHLVACGNIIRSVRSLYWWQGAIQDDNEVCIILKTRQDHVDQVITHVKANHSYTVPEIISLPITQGNPAYLQWIDDSLNKSVI